jgi:predicted membrane-bound mannosyltransferase
VLASSSATFIIIIISFYAPVFGVKWSSRILFRLLLLNLT